MDPNRALLTEGLQALELPASPAQQDQLLELASLLERWSQRINLTGHRSADEIVRRLILEAAALLQQLPDLASLADLGSGAGFPGLPIAILRPDWQLTLVEARERRHHFQRTAARGLRIGNVRLLRGRAEELEPTPHAGVVAQAMGSPDRVARWMSRWAQPAGQLFLPVSTGQTPDVLAGVTQLRLVRDIRYQVPCGGPERRLWVTEWGEFTAED